MSLSIPLFDRIAGFLQIFDTSLGICIEAEEITLVHLRRGMRGFRVLKTASLVCPPPAELSQRIRALIDRERMRATYTVVGLPQAAVLLKQCSIPLMPEGEIEGYLAAHPALFLPPGLESGPFQYRFHRLETDETQLRLQLLIYRTGQVETYSRMLTGLPVYRLFAGNLGLINPGNPVIAAVLKHAGIEPLESEGALEAGRFTDAFSLSLIPFGGPAAKCSLHLPNVNGDADAIFFRRLTLKSALFLGTVLLFAAGGFGLINTVMARQWRQEALRQEALAPLLTLRDSLAQRLDSLSHSRERLTRLAGSRSRCGFYLYRVAAILPEGVWFREIRMDVSASGALAVQLAGQARDAAQLTRFLTTLETQPFITEMLLEDMAVRPEGREAGRCEFRVRVHVAH